MKRVIRQEDFYYDEEEEKKDKPNRKKLVLKGLKKLLIVALIALGATAGYKYYENVQFKKLQHQVIEAEAIIARMEIDGRILEIATPHLREVDGELKYVAPDGFTRDATGLCYRITDTPKAVDDGKEYIAPEGMVLVGSKAVDVIDPDIEMINGEEVRTCPEGYELVGILGVRIIDAIEIEPTMSR